MTRLTTARSPTTINAKHVRLPRDEEAADELVRDIIEGRADQYRYTQNERQEAA